jgi:UDP-2-acetamido-2-deoxy-ribo-hexuluronate aminotransferase
MVTQAIPFFSGARGLRDARPRLERRLREVADRGVFTSGPAVAELERELMRVTDAEHVVAVGNGTDGLILMLRAADVGPGDQVIVPTYTFVASASAVAHVGAEPVMVDIEPGSYGMDPACVEAAITPSTKAIMPVHLFSQMADVVRLRALADAYGLDMLEDSAEGIGMRVDGRHAGLWGRAGILSFFPTKTLGALGDAGAVLTDDAELAERVRRLRCHGQATDGSYIYEELGYNSRCDEIQAAVLLTRLETLEDDIARRGRLAALYTEQLADLEPLLSTPRAPAAGQGDSVFYVYLVETDRRNELVRFLTEHRVGTETYYPRPLSLQPCLARGAGARQPFPVAKAASRRAVALPLYPDLADEEVHHVCALIRRFFGVAR